MNPKILTRSCTCLRVVSLLMWSASAVAYAQSASQESTESPQSQDAVLLHETVVVSTRTPQNVSETLADVSVVDQETIFNSGAESLSDVLSALPGIEVSRYGGPGQGSSVFIRGGENPYTVVFIDGVRVESQSQGGMTWEQIPLGLFDRVEVMRGPASAFYGADAVSGVVQLFTRQGGNDGEGVLRSYAGAGYGRYDTARAEAGFSGASGAWDYSLAGLRSTSAGFNVGLQPGNSPDADGYRSTSGHARVGWSLNPDHRLDLTWLGANMNAGYDTFDGLSDERTLYDLQVAGLSWQARWNSVYTSRVTVSESRNRYETRPSPFTSDTQLSGLLWQNDWRFGMHQFNASVEHREDVLHTADIHQGRQQDALALGYAVRWQRHALQIQALSNHDSEFGAHHTGSLSYGYDLSPQWRASLSGATAFRAPTLYQLGSEYGVLTLKPEQARHVEAGVRYQQNHTHWGWVLYRNRVHDAITFGDPGPCASEFGCYANTARALYEGMTFSAQHRMGGVSWNASVDFQNPRDLETNHVLARRSRQHASLEVKKNWLQWQWGAQMQAYGHRFDDASNTVRLGGYTLFNLYASNTLDKHWNFLVRLDNVTDKNYQQAYGYATPGRNLYVGLRWMSW